MKNIPDTAVNINPQEAKENIQEGLPTPPPLTAKSSPEQLKARLLWGEPALTIIDVRDRTAFNLERITGAVPMSQEDLVTQAKNNLEFDRDIYIYGEEEEQTATAASALRAAGYIKVAELQGGLPAWKAIGGPIEGSAT